MKKCDYIFDAFQDLFVGISITITVAIMLGKFEGIIMFVMDTALAFLINYIAGLIINTRKIAGFIVNKASMNIKYMPLIQCIINSVIYVAVIASIMFAIKVGMNAILVMMLIKMYLPLVIVAFIVGFIMAPISIKITNFLYRK